MSYQATAPVVVHRSDADFYYMDFGPILKGRTIASISSVTCTGATVASTSVLTDATTVVLGEGNSLLIEASTGIKFKISALAASTTYTVVAVVTLSDGNTLGLDGILKTG